MCDGVYIFSDLSEKTYFYRITIAGTLSVFLDNGKNYYLLTTMSIEGNIASCSLEATKGEI